MVREFHVYLNACNPIVGQIHRYVREQGNAGNPYVVSRSQTHPPFWYQTASPAVRYQKGGWVWLRETNPYAVAVLCDSAIVGHIPWNILAVCALFLQTKGLINCVVTGSWCYSSDLPQWGLVRTLFMGFGTYTFHGVKKFIQRLKKLLITLSTSDDFHFESSEPQHKKLG